MFDTASATGKRVLIWRDAEHASFWVPDNLAILGFPITLAVVLRAIEKTRQEFGGHVHAIHVDGFLTTQGETGIRWNLEHDIPFGRGALYYVLSNYFYIGEVKYKNEILPDEQPPIMDRTLFEAVRQKSLAQWSHRTIVRNKSDHLLTGLLFDDAGHRMIPTHSTEAGVRYRYYASTPVLHGEAKTASAGSVSRIPAADIEDVIVESLQEHLAANQGKATTSAESLLDRETLAELVAGIVVHSDRLIISLKSHSADDPSDSEDVRSLTIPWQKPPSRRSRQILLPHNALPSDARPEQFERRARLVSTIAEVVSGSMMWSRVG
jgi:site-specific DNA recombinase